MMYSRNQQHDRRPFAIERLEPRTLLSGLAVTYASSNSDISGLSTLSYNGVQLINNSLANKQFQVNRYYTLNPGGATYTAVYGGTGFTPNWNLATDTLTYTYSWGTLACQYVQVDSNRLNMLFTVNNAASSGVTLGGLDLYPAAITFPNALVPSNETQIVHNPTPPSPFWSPEITYGSDGPAVIPADYSGTGNTGAVMAMANDSPATKQMYTSLWTYNDVATNHDYFMFVGTGPKDSMLPPPQYSNTPLLYQKTAPGQSDSFAISLRFGPAGADLMTLAPDVESAYAAAYPDTVNWPDRRPIASLHITSPPTHALNPEGWLNNVNVDYTSNQTALNNFAAALLSDASGTVTQMQNDNAQGVIVWDVEGQRWPQATTYIGDPSLASSLYPNATDSIEQPVTLNDGTVTTPMAYNYNGNGLLIDQFFAVFRSAGFRTGMTIRPTVITFTGTNGNPTQSSPVSPQTETSVLEAKIQYAYATWGCTLFYLDSNSGLDRDALAQVQAAYPFVLIIPEHSYTSVYASSAPYGQLLTYDFVGTPTDVRLTYPNAFSVIYPADGDGGKSNIPDYYAAAETNVALGDIILFRGWFADAYNTTMVNIYNQAVPAPPATPTGLTATAVNGVVNLSWNAVTGTGIYGSGVYNIKRSATSGGPYATISSGVQQTTYTDTTAVNGTHYYYVVSAVNGRGQGSNSNQATASPSAAAGPTVVVGAHAVDFTGITANLAVLGNDAAAEANLTYTWSSASTPANLSQPTYSANATNAAKYATVTFKQTGTYTLTVTITDGNHLSVTSSVTAVVNAVLQSLTILPTNAAVAGGTTLQEVVTGIDQFGNGVSSPTVAWTTTGGGLIDGNSGVFSANQSGGNYSVTAVSQSLQSGTLQSSTGITVVPTIFNGTSGNDSYTLRLNPANASQDQLVVSLFGTGPVTYTIASSQYPSLTINPSGGNDSLTVDLSYGNPVPAGGVAFNGGANASGNALYVTSTAAGGLSFSIDATKVTPALSSSITYSNLQKLEFDLSGGGNALTQQGQPSAPLIYNAGTGNNMLTVNAGLYSFSADPQATDGNLILNNNAAVLFNAAPAGSGISRFHLAAVNLGANATAVAANPSSHADRSLLVLGTLSLSPTSRLDLGGNDLMLHSTAANRATDLLRLSGYLTNSDLWSSSAAADASHLTTLGLILNDDGTGNAPIEIFDGQSSTDSDLLVKYTYFGDSNLDGKVDGSDYSRIDSAFLKANATGWFNGDFNSDGVINGSDYTLIDNAFNQQGASLASMLASEVSDVSIVQLPSGWKRKDISALSTYRSFSIDDLLNLCEPR